MTDVEQCSLDEHSAVDPNSVLSLLRDFERTEDDPARPLAVVQMEKYLFGAKPGSELRYGTVRNAMEQTDGRLCLRFDDGYGHGYLALVDGELSRLMKPEGFDRYNGPYGISVDLLNKWLRNESVRLTVRGDTPFATEDDGPEVRTDGGVDQPGTERSPFDAKPLDAEEYRDLLAENPSLVLRVSDGTGDGTYRFWVDDGTLFWRCLNWGSPQQSAQVHLEAVLDDVPGDATTQLLVERATETEVGTDE